MHFSGPGSLPQDTFAHFHQPQPRIRLLSRNVPSTISNTTQKGTQPAPFHDPLTVRLGRGLRFLWYMARTTDFPQMAAFAAPGSRMTSHICDNTRSTQQPHCTQVGEGDDDNGDKYKADDCQDTKRDGDGDTKDGGEDEEEEDEEEEFETEDDISENPDTCPNQGNGSITLACQPTQHLLTRWNPPQ